MKRIQELRRKIRNIEHEQNEKTWIEVELIGKSLEIEERLRKKERSDYWEIKKEELIASPSDIGMHNMIWTKKGYIYIDFEYAGKDDICKLLADLVVQPRHRLNSKKEELLMESIDRSTKEEKASWMYRYELIKPLITMKWCMIMLKKAANGIADEKCLEEAKKYFYEMY